MIMEIKDFLVNEIDKRAELSKYFKETVKIEPTVVNVDEESEQEEIEIDKQAVIDYLNKSGYKLTQENYDLAEKMLKNMRGKELRETVANGAASRIQYQYKTVNHLNDMSVEELQPLLNVALLNTLNEISARLDDLNRKVQEPKSVRYDYKIETIRDKQFFGAGGTNTVMLNNIISKYASQGYRISNVFTNELGKNAHTVGGVNYNSTIDEVVLIFEKKIYS